MRAALVLALLAGSACGLSASSRPDPGDVRAAAVRMDVALDRAVDAHAQGEAEGALQAWREAHVAWDTTLGPGLEQQIGDQEVISLELHLARIRQALEGGSTSTVRARVHAFDEALESPLRSLPPAPQTAPEG